MNIGNVGDSSEMALGDYVSMPFIFITPFVFRFRRSGNNAASSDRQLLIDSTLLRSAEDSRKKSREE